MLQTPFPMIPNEDSEIEPRGIVLKVKKNTRRMKDAVRRPVSSRAMLLYGTVDD
jgi:hypothetical protein